MWDEAKTVGSKIYSTKCFCWKQRKVFNQQSEFLPQETRTRSKINPKQAGGRKQLIKEHKSMKLKIEKKQRKSIRQKALSLGKNSRIDETSWKADEGKNSFHKPLISEMKLEDITKDLVVFKKIIKKYNGQLTLIN